VVIIKSEHSGNIKLGNGVVKIKMIQSGKMNFGKGVVKIISDIIR
jgi:hypothetical protein